MTSSDRHLQGSPYWDFEKPTYKQYDEFCEPGLISVLFLSCGRPDVTERSLQSTLRAANQYDGEVEWLFMEQGNCEENYQLFNTLAIDRKVVIRQPNFGINNGLNQLWALSRGEFCMVHENDWINSQPEVNFLAIAKSIFEEKGDVGIVQLRAVRDPNENWGLGKPEYSPWSCSPDQNEQAGVKLWQEETEVGHQFFIASFPNGFNNNPMLMRKKLYRECGPYPEPPVGSDPRHGETEYQARVAGSGAITAHIGMELYYHIGKQPTSRR